MGTWGRKTNQATFASIMFIKKLWEGFGGGGVGRRECQISLNPFRAKLRLLKEAGAKLRVGNLTFLLLLA